MERALVRREAIGVSGIKREEFASVLQHDPGTPADQTAAKSLKETVDEGDGVSLLIHRAKNLGIAGNWSESGFISVGAARANEPSPLCGIGLVEESPDGNGGQLRIGEIAVPVLKREFFDLNQEVEIGGRIVSQRGRIVTFEHVKHLQDGHPLRVGRHLIDLVSTIGGVDGLNPCGAVVPKVFNG